MPAFPGSHAWVLSCSGGSGREVGRVVTYEAPCHPLRHGDTVVLPAVLRIDLEHVRHVEVWHGRGVWRHLLAEVYRHDGLGIGRSKCMDLVNPGRGEIRVQLAQIRQELCQSLLA